MILPKPTKPVILTCVQPSGRLHLGNYLGAIQNWMNYLDEGECYFGIADLHTLTNCQITPADRRQASLQCIAQYIACGLDPKKCFLFLQSQIVGHSELAWILACHCGIGKLERMTQFKEKSKDIKAHYSINAGLLYYPILMAADILLYNANKVPIGEDQQQHLELTRDLAQTFNHTYSETFYLPNPEKVSIGARIASLAEPSKKMSKSDANTQATLFITDTPEAITKKIMSAVTDSKTKVKYSGTKTGIDNLLTIFSICNQTPIHTLEKKFEAASYQEFKNAVATNLIEMLSPIRDRYEVLIKDKNILMDILNEHHQTVQKKAFKTLNKVKRKVGLL